MTVPRFVVGAHNAHYDGGYEPWMLEWRRLGAADKLTNILQTLGAHRSSIESVLEVGCGTGAVLAAICAHGVGYRHCGIDLSDPHDHLDPGLDVSKLTLSRYDGVKIPFDDNSFDLVIASHVLEHVPDERGFLHELKRVSRRVIYVEVPCELHLRSSAAALQTSLNIGHINAYTPESFALTLATSELEIEDFALFDHSLELLTFGTSALRGRLLKAVRSALLKTNSTLASRIFCYHAGALCRV
jgi:SAM-dependent methyltransferase